MSFPPAAYLSPVLICSRCIASYLLGYAYLFQVILFTFLCLCSVQVCRPVFHIVFIVCPQKKLVLLMA